MKPKRDSDKNNPIRLGYAALIFPSLLTKYDLTEAINQHAPLITKESQDLGILTMRF